MTNPTITAIERRSSSPLRMWEVVCYIHHYDGLVVGYEVLEADILDDWVFISSDDLSDQKKEKLEALLKAELSKKNIREKELEF